MHKFEEDFKLRNSAHFLTDGSCMTELLTSLSDLLETVSRDELSILNILLTGSSEKLVFADTINTLSCCLSNIYAMR